MSDYLNIAIIALVGLVQASLQLNLGGLILLYHASIGKHRRRKTRYLAKSYIWGAMAINFLAVCASCFIIDRIFSGVMDTKWILITIGALLGCGIIMWIFYYKSGSGTQTWLPRSFTRYIRRRARETNDNISAFSLGLLSAFGEMPLSLALYVVAGNAILLTSDKYQVLAAIFYAILTAMPMVVLKLRIKSGSNVVAAQRWRSKNKRFTRVISGFGFMILGWFILTYWVL